MAPQAAPYAGDLSQHTFGKQLAKHVGYLPQPSSMVISTVRGQQLIKWHMGCGERKLLRELNLYFLWSLVSKVLNKQSKITLRFFHCYWSSNSLLLRCHLLCGSSSIGIDQGGKEGRNRTPKNIRGCWIRSMIHLAQHPHCGQPGNRQAGPGFRSRGFQQKHTASGRGLIKSQWLFLHKTLNYS